MRKLTIAELKSLIREEFKDAQKTDKMKIKQKNWWEADPENDIDWMKALKIKEVFAYGYGDEDKNKK